MKELLNKLIPFKTKKEQTINESNAHQKLIDKLLNDPNHEWIKNDRLMSRSFVELWSLLKPSHVQFF